MAVSGSTDTLARLFCRRVDATPDRDAQIVKRGSTWVRSTWAEVGAIVREVALGFLALGRSPGDAVAILSRSRPEWVQADFAVFSIGGVTVPIYPTSTAEQIAYVVNDTCARTLIVEDAALLARVAEARGRVAGLEQLVVIDGSSGDVGALTWEGLRRLGRERAGPLAAVLAERLGAQRPDDVATVVYTSGTTGVPKGVVQTHGNHVAMLRALADIPLVRPGDVHLLFLPLAHAFARVEAFVAVHRGLTTAFAEGFDRIGENLREVRPDFIFGVPRLFEKAQARIQAEVEEASAVRRALFRCALRVGRRRCTLRQAHASVPPGLRLAHAVAQRAVLAPVQAGFGGRLRFAVSGGAPLGVETAEFFHAVGIPVLEGYGLTEACPVLTFNRLDSFRLGSVGRPLPGVELRLALDGEILARGPTIAREYLNKPSETAEVFGADGWLRTGDIGRMDDEGFVYITDRKKDLIVTSGGLHVAPQPIEDQLRREPLIAEATVHGDRRPYPTALLTLTPEAVARFARAQGIPTTDWPALVQHPAVLDRVRAIVEATNATLPPHARIKRFAVVPEQFSEAGGELTPTQKVKRRVIADRYRTVLEGLYR